MADGLHHYGDVLGFFPDDLLGEDPQAMKAGLKQQFATLLDRDCEHLRLRTAIRSSAAGEPPSRRS